MSQDEERIALQSVPVHRLPAGLHEYEDLHFPVDHHQVNNLLGQILTQIEAMNLNPKSEAAAKAIFKQMVWRWFDEAMDNSITSKNGCIAPIKIKDCSCSPNALCSNCRFIEGVKLVDPNIDPFESLRPSTASAPVD